MVLLPPFDRRPGSGGAAFSVVFLASVRTAAALGQPAAHRMVLAGFPGSVIKWPVGRPDRRASCPS